nr:hypothetical protein [Tanacetum cinerariifolium]
MCPRLVEIILGLLRSPNDLEDFLDTAKGRKNKFHKSLIINCLQMDENDEISNLVDLHMYLLCGGWKWQELLLWWM